MTLEGEEEQVDTDTQRKKPDAWVVSWDKRHLFILEFTRPNDRCELSLHGTTTFKTAQYTPLRNLLAARLLQGWEVDIQTYTVGIRGSYDPDRWHAQLQRFGMTGAQSGSLVEAGPGVPPPSALWLWSTLWWKPQCLSTADVPCCGGLGSGPP
jgi:hypothetical protein